MALLALRRKMQQQGQKSIGDGGGEVSNSNSELAAYEEAARRSRIADQRGRAKENFLGTSDRSGTHGDARVRPPLSLGAQMGFAGMNPGIQGVPPAPLGAAILAAAAERKAEVSGSGQEEKERQRRRRRRVD